MVEDVFSKISLVKNNKAQNKLMQQRSVLLFNSAIKSEETMRHYTMFLDEFKDHFIIKSYDKLVTIEPKKIQEMLETFLMYQNQQGHSLSYINGKLSALKLFFGMNDVVALNWLKLRKMLPEKKKLTGDKPYKTKDIQLILKNTVNQKFRCLIHFLSASGVRIGSFETMKLKHLEDMPNNCKSVLVYEDDKSEYSTFIHHEAVEALDEYLAYRTRMGEIITPNSWVIPSTMDSNKPVTTASITTQMNRFARQNLVQDKKRGRYEIQACHGYRKRFNTVLKSNPNININLSEKMMGHSTTIALDNVYFKPVIEQLFDEYQKAIPELIIDDKYRLEEQLKKKDEKINELNQKDNEIDMLKQTILEIKNNMLEIQNKIIS
jgi:site-specific recombinase XerD